MSNEELQVGQKLDEFQIVAKLSDNKPVYRVRGKLGELALKLINAGVAQDPDFKEQLQFEIGTLSQKSENLVKLRDYNLAASPAYLVMELISGPTLEQRLSTQDKPLSLAESVAIVRQICQAAALLEQPQARPRNIDPAHIMIKSVEGLPDQAVLIGHGLGPAPAQPQYAAPELKGDVAAADARSHVFALAAILYRLTARTVPASAPPTEFTPDFSPILEDVIKKAMDPEPARRYASPEALAGALDNLERTFPNPNEIADFQFEGDVIRVIDREGRPVWPDIALDREILAGQPLKIGRDPANDHQLDHPSIAGEHIEIGFNKATNNFTIKRLVPTNSSDPAKYIVLLHGTRIVPNLTDPDPWPSGQWVQIGQYGLLLRQKDRQTGPQVSSELKGSFYPDTGAPIMLAAGKENRVVLRLTYYGSRPDRFDIVVPPDKPMPDGWAWTSAGEFVMSANQEDKRVDLTLTVPQKTVAGIYPLTLRVKNRQGDVITDISHEFEIKPFNKFEVRPTLLENARAGRPVQFEIYNQGNSPASFELQGTTDDLKYTFPSRSVKVEPYSKEEISFKTRPAKLHLFGNKKDYQLIVQVRSQTDRPETRTVKGNVISRPWVPSWLLVTTVIVVLLASLAAFGWLLTIPKVEITSVNDAAPPMPGTPVTITAGTPVAIQWDTQPWWIYGWTLEQVNINSTPVTPSANSYTWPADSLPVNSFVISATDRLNRRASDIVGVSVIIPTVTPTPFAAPEITLSTSPDPAQVIRGDTVTVKWEVTNANTVTLQGLGDPKPVAAADELKLAVLENTKLTLIASSQLTETTTISKSVEILVTGSPGGGSGDAPGGEQPSDGQDSTSPGNGNGPAAPGNGQTPGEQDDEETDGDEEAPEPTPTITPTPTPDPAIVSLKPPPQGFVITEPTPVVIEAVVDYEGTIDRVDFFLQDALVGSSSDEPYLVTLPNPTIRVLTPSTTSYTIKATAFDDLRRPANATPLKIDIQTTITYPP